MTDARFPDRWLLDRRFMTLSPDAFRTYVVALVWSVSNRTDGAVDSEALCLIPGGVSDTAAGVLVRKGLWRSTGDGFEIVDFAVTQTSSAQLASQEAYAARERQRKAKQKPKSDRAGNARADPARTRERTQDRKGQDTLGEEEKVSADQRYSGSDVESMLSPRQDRLSGESAEWERNWGSEAS